MNFDFHTHAKLSKKADFSLSYIEEMAQKALQSGLDGIALTEHFNTKNFHEVYETLDAHFPYVDGYYDIFGLKVFPGMEVDILEVGHILCIGDLQDVRAMREELDDLQKRDHSFPLLTFEAAVQLRNACHWCPSVSTSYTIKGFDSSLLKQLDAFDLNGKDLHTRGIEENIKDVNRFAYRLINLLLAEVIPIILCNMDLYTRFFISHARM